MYSVLRQASSLTLCDPCYAYAVLRPDIKAFLADSGRANERGTTRLHVWFCSAHALSHSD